jgi:hypothetical protein
MNQLASEVSSEDVDEQTASNSEPVSNEDLTAMQEANKAPPEDHDNNKIIQCSPTKTLNVKNFNEAFTYFEKLLNTAEEFKPNARKRSVLC